MEAFWRGASAVYLQKCTGQSDPQNAERLTRDLLVLDLLLELLQLLELLELLFLCYLLLRGEH